MGLAPIAEVFHHGDERFAQWREAILHLGRDLRIFLAMNETIGFQLPERVGQGFK